MPKISVDVSMEQFLLVIEGSEKSPDFFVEKLVNDIRSLCFTQKLKQNETLEKRQSTITEVWKSCEKSNNYYLLTEVALNALSCKKTGDKNAYRILKFFVKNKSDAFCQFATCNIGINLYPKSMLRALNTYYRQKLNEITSDMAFDDDDPAKTIPIGEWIEGKYFLLKELSTSINLFEPPSNVNVEVDVEQSVADINSGT